MARGEDTSKHPNRGVSRSYFPERQKPVPPSGYGNYSDPSTRDAQRNTDRDFDKQEYDYNEHIKRSK